MAGVFEILKKRWPEAALVIILQAGLIVLAEQIYDLAEPAEAAAAGGDLSEPMDLVLIAGTTALAVICQMLNLGFLRTVYTDGACPQEPVVLLRVGRYFFWRIFCFTFFLGFGWLFLSLMILVTVNTIMLGQKEMQNIPQWMGQLCNLAALVIFAKPMLLIPAVIIARDCKSLEALATFNRYKLLKGRGLSLLKLFLGCFGLTFLVSLVVSAVNSSGFYHFASVGAYAITVSAVTLVVGLGAVQFIASQTEPAAETIDEESEEDF